LTIDGENRSFGRPLMVAQLLERIGLDGRKVAVEPNHEIVKNPITLVSACTRVTNW